MADSNDVMLAALLERNGELFATYGAWAAAQIKLLAGTIDDPDSFNAQGGKTGALGYYPVENVSGQIIYVPCLARLQVIAAGGGGNLGAVEAVLATTVQAKDGAVAARQAAENIAGAIPDIMQPYVDEAQGLVGAAQTTLQTRASGVRSRNLFNPGPFVAGKIMAQNGAITDHADYGYGQSIAVTPGQVYYGKNSRTGSNMRFVTFFDADGVVMASAGLSNVVTFTAPAGAARIVLTIHMYDYTAFQFELGATQTGFEEFSTTVFLAPSALPDRVVTSAKVAARAITPAKTNFLAVGKNLFDKAAATLGYYLPHDGTPPVASAAFAYSDFIPVTPGQPYHGRANTTGMRFVTYYDANFVYVAGGGENSVAPNVVTFTTPAGVAYIRFTLFQSEINSFQFEEGAAQTPYAPFQYVLGGKVPITAPVPDASVTTQKLADRSVTPEKAAFLRRGKNLFDKGKATLGYFRGHDNSTSASGTFGYSDYIAVTPGQQLVSNQGMRFTTFYNASKVFVAGGSSSETNTITVPANVYFVVVTFYAGSINTFQLEIGTAATAFEAYGYRFTDDIPGVGSVVAAPGWAGKTWATLGDSITANPIWQPAVAQALGMLHTNFGIGGTRISGPSGDANSMCQDARINAIATTFDVISMMGGTNDWAQNIALGAENSTDPTTFNGALNTFAAKAYARWPAKRIVLATTPYGEIVDWQGRGNWTSPAHNSLGLTTNDYAEAIRKASLRHNLALIDVARTAGWGSLNITPALGGSTTDHLHPAAGSLAAKGISAAYRGGLRAIEPLVA